MLTLGRIGQIARPRATPTFAPPRLARPMTVRNFSNGNVEKTADKREVEIKRRGRWGFPRSLMDDFFDDFPRFPSMMMRSPLATMDRFFPEFRDWDLAPSRTFDWIPSADITQTKDSFQISLELPGIPKENIKINVDNMRLTISGEKKQETEEKDESRRTYRRERVYGSFSRSFNLPDNVNPKQIKATYENGVLKVTVPKTEPSEDTIEVKIE